MIFDIIQTVSNLSASYEARSGEQPIGSAHLANNFLLGGTCDCEFLGEPYSLSYLPIQQAASWLKPRQEKTGVPYQISRGSQKAGDICVKLSDGGLLSRFEFFFMNLCGRSYCLYQIGLGKEGMKYPIYEGESQIALIEKNTTVHNRLDMYCVSALDSNAGLVSFLFCLYLDMKEFSNRGEVSFASVEKTYRYTTKKRLKAKYDPNFKRQITR